MRILRLTNSNDFNDDIPEHLRGDAITRNAVAEAIGEPVETVSRAFWPSPRLPGLLEGWLNEYQPDAVLIRAAAYWVSFESVPLRIERRLGAFGSWPAGLGRAIGSEPTVASNWLARRARRLAVRAIGGDTYFTPAAAAEHVGDLLRVIRAKESLVTVVRGPGHAHNTAGTKGGLRRAQQRNREFEALLEDLCGKMHATFVSAAPAAAAAHALGKDDVHSTAEGQRAFADLEAKAIAAAWAAGSAKDC